MKDSSLMTSKIVNIGYKYLTALPTINPDNEFFNSFLRPDEIKWSYYYYFVLLYMA